MGKVVPFLGRGVQTRASVCRCTDTFILMEKGIVYFRIRGWGLWFASYKVVPMLFSERNGLERTLRLWGWRVKILRPTI